MPFEEELEHGLKLIKQKKYNEAIDVAKDLQYMEREAAEGYRLEAMALQHKKQWKESVRAADKALECDPEDAGLYNLRGYAYLNQEKLDKAEKDFQKAIELDDHPAAHRNLVLHKIMNDQASDALNYLLNRIRENPKDVENWILMGDLMKRGGHDDKARSYYEQAQKMDPDNEYIKKQLEEA